MVFSVNAAIENLPPDAREDAIQKVELVHAAQRRLGMEPRDDSYLTFNYACGELDRDDSSAYVPSTIANELFIVDRIHKETTYSHILEDAMREIAHVIRAQYRLDWVTTWEIVRFYGPTLIKLYCFKRLQTQ